MKRLLLLRHAKASRDKHGIEDFDRTLTDRGRSDAILMGQALREEGWVPGLVLCSTAARTRETLELVLPQLGAKPAVLYLAELYLPRWLAIVKLVRQVEDPARILMVVAHNPGIEDCARKLARPPGDGKARKLHARLAENFPTAAVAGLEFDTGSWDGVARGEGDLELLVHPRDLRGPLPS